MTTANPERGEVDLVVGGKTYILALTTNMICALEKRTGKAYGEMLGSLFRMDHEVMRQLLWGALQRHHSKTFDKVEKVGDLMDELGDYRLAVDRFTELGKANQKKTKEGDKDGESANPPDAQASTGGPLRLTLAESA